MCKSIECWENEGGAVKRPSKSKTLGVEDRWMVLPPTPGLPKATASGHAPVNGIKIWYAVFGKGKPVILLHGGLGNSNYWGTQVRALSKHFRVIVMDSRGHGRSTRDNLPYSYSLMASDVLGLMDYVKIKKAAIVGWSDGANVGLDIAVNHPERISKLFAFAGNSDPSGTMDASKSAAFSAYVRRVKKEYMTLSPTPTQYDAFCNQVRKMWATQPNFTKGHLSRIKASTWIVGADHDEAITRENTEFMAANIPNAGLLIQAQVSHFSLLQDPRQFNDDLLHFLQHSPNAN